jgi:exodeoxyribonuclease VII small subunit
MVKSSKKAAAKTGGTARVVSADIVNFEERLKRLETLGEQIRKTDIPLDEALRAFEEGIKLARTLEKDIETIDSRIEILMNNADAEEDAPPELELFATEA